MSQTSPDSASADDPVTILRGWAKAYRDSPEHRFPSDPDAEFFPVDLELAAFEIERLRADYRFLTESWHVAKRNQFAAEAIARSRDYAQRLAEPLSLQAAREDERLACWKIAENERQTASVDKAAWLVAFDIANAIKMRSVADSSTLGNSK